MAVFFIMDNNELYLNNLSLVNFKNYEAESFEFSPKLNCIVGENGMGKTNLLDAIHVLCLGKSHFLHSDQHLIYNEEQFFRLQSKFLRSNKLEEIIVKYKLRSKKTIERNKVTYQKFSEHIGFLPLIFIAPDDVQLILQGSEERRKFMDICLVQTDEIYLNNLILYNQILDQRNALLKNADFYNNPPIDLLEIYDSQLVAPAKYIYSKRKSFVQELLPNFIKFYAAISADKENVNILYNSQLEKNDFEALLKEFRQKDILLQRTGAGIHKDDLELEMKNLPLKKFASQGQLKSFVLSMKLAQYEILKKILNISPILLLDDIFDKLDANRVKQLLEILLNKDFGQIFLTDTHVDRISAILDNLDIVPVYKKIVIKER